MKDYVVLFNQGDNGCDYTIGCGKRFTFFQAEDLEDARLKVFEKREDERHKEYNIHYFGGQAGSERELKQAIIIEIGSKFEVVNMGEQTDLCTKLRVLQKLSPEERRVLGV